jgi:uncharacterized protein YkwD
VPSDDFVAELPAVRRWSSGRLAVRAAVSSFVALLVIGVPVASGQQNTSSADSHVFSAADSPVLSGQLQPGPAAPAPPPAPAAPPAQVVAPVPAARPAPKPVPKPVSKPAVAPAQRAAAQPADASLEGQVLALVNVQRAAAGCGALVQDEGLAKVARGHSADMRDRHFFSHTNPDGLDPFARARAAGQTNARAENIAVGQASPAAVMVSWMNSSGHRANILNCQLRSLGVGVAEGAGGPWWTQLFGG